MVLSDFGESGETRHGGLYHQDLRHQRAGQQTSVRRDVGQGECDRAPGLGVCAGARPARPWRRLGKKELLLPAPRFPLRCLPCRSAPSSGPGWPSALKAGWRKLRKFWPSGPFGGERQPLRGGGRCLSPHRADLPRLRRPASRGFWWLLPQTLAINGLPPRQPSKDSRRPEARVSGWHPFQKGNKGLGTQTGYGTLF